MQPALAAMLAAWRLGGFPRLYCRTPQGADLVVPSRSDGRSPRSKKSLERLKEDCERVGVVAPPHARHSMRASFVTWLDEDGARESIARVVTHGRDRSNADARRGYARHGWEALCAEVAKLRVQRVTDDAPTARRGER